MLDTVHHLLAARVELAQRIPEDHTPEAVAAELGSLGIPAVVQSPDGRTLEASPPVPVSAPAPPFVGRGLLRPEIHTDLVRPDGTTVTVYASLIGVERTMSRLLLLMTAATAAGLALAWLGLRRAADVALRPLDDVIAVADRTAAGGAGQRLHPIRTDTELGRLATALDRMLDALEQAIGDARAAEERSHTFLADAAHLLRSPVAVIRATVQLVLHTDDPRDRDRLFSHLIRETARVSRLISGLLRLARLEEGEAFEREPTRLAELCEQAVDRARDLSPGLTVSLRVAGHPGLVAIDAEAVAEALTNLLDNARRHATSRIDVLLTVEDGKACVRVNDDGPGVPADVQERMFGRFVSLDAQGGSGLGLPVARAVARSHGGDVDYREGSFAFWLPVASPAAQTAPTTARPE